MSQASGLFLHWDVNNSNTTTIKAPDNKHVQKTAAADVYPCWAVLGRFGQNDLSPLRQQSREDVEKTAPSQLLQGVLQCRGVTEKYEARRQLVQQSAAQSLPPFPAMPHFFLFSLLLSFTPDILSVSLPSLSLHVLHSYTRTLRALVILWPIITAA